jgi:biopolymer transport protein ExbD
MRLQRKTRLLIEAPAVATGDIAFNLLVFFLVCAAPPEGQGRRQEIPRSEQQQKTEQGQNIEVKLTRTSATITPPLEVVNYDRFPERIRQQLAEKKTAQDRVVIIKSDRDVPYERWIRATAAIEQAGGIITVQLEEERTVVVP